MTEQKKTVPMTLVQAAEIETKVDAVKTAVDEFKPNLSEGESVKLRHYSESYNEVMTEIGEFVTSNPGVISADTDEQNFMDAKNRHFRMIPIKSKLSIIDRIVADMDIVDGHILVNFMDIAYSALGKSIGNGHNEYKPIHDNIAVLYKKNNLNPPAIMELTPALEMTLNTHKPGSRLINSGSTIIEMHIGAIKTVNPTIINPDGSAIIPTSVKTILIVNRSKTDIGQITIRLKN